MRVTAKVPPAIPVVIVAICVAGAIAGVAGLWVILGAAVIIGTALLALLARRWGRSLSGEFSAAQAATGRRPYLEPQWPRWFKIADPKFGALLMVGLAMGLLVLVLLALIVSHL